MSADVHLQAGPGGLAQLTVDGADVTPFVKGVGFDSSSEGTRLVLEGTGRLESALESVEVEFSRLPMLRPDDVALLRAGADAFEDGSAEYERYVLLVERLEDLSAAAEQP